MTNGIQSNRTNNKNNTNKKINTNKKNNSNKNNSNNNNNNKKKNTNNTDSNSNTNNTDHSNSNKISLSMDEQRKGQSNRNLNRSNSNDNRSVNSNDNRSVNSNDNIFKSNFNNHVINDVDFLLCDLDDLSLEGDDENEREKREDKKVNILTGKQETQESMSNIILSDINLLLFSQRDNNNNNNQKADNDLPFFRAMHQLNGMMQYFALFIASSHQIFQKCQNFLIFCIGIIYFLKNLMGTCNSNLFSNLLSNL
jgi:hypothetical protein